MLGSTVVACAPAPNQPPRGGRCEYRATLLKAAAGALRVDARCDGSGYQSLSVDSGMAPFVTLERGARKVADGWRLSDGRFDIRYRFDLAGAAAAADHFDRAIRVGDSWFAPGSTWLLRPDPVPIGAAVHLRVNTPPGASFHTGLRRSAGGYALRAEELRVATYTAFGKTRRVTTRLPHIGSGQATLETVMLDGPFTVSQTTASEWTTSAARAVAEFYGGFPTSGAMVTLVPTPDESRVVFGKVLPASEPGVAVLLGSDATKTDLYKDWVLVHELFHLGFPSFLREGKWLDEGLATYYEPIIRARAGWYTEQQVWAEFASAMSRGLPAVTETGLENVEGFSGVYWGGAIVCLLADLSSRQRTGKGLEVGLRAVLAAGGNATRVWPLRRAIDTIDQALGGTTLRDLSARHARRGSPVDLNALFRRLGIVATTGGVRLDETAPLAAVRRAIVYGAAGGT